MALRYARGRDIVRFLKGGASSQEFFKTGFKNLQKGKGRGCLLSLEGRHFFGWKKERG